MVYKRYVQIGRVAMITYGPDEGKLCVIVDVVDQTRALVDGPCSGVKRQAISFKWLALTSIVIKIAPSQRSGGIRKAWEKADVKGQWEKTAWAKRLADKERRQSMTDFDRFKLKIAKQMKRNVVKSKVKKLKKEQAAE